MRRRARWFAALPSLALLTLLLGAEGALRWRGGRPGEPVSANLEYAYFEPARPFYAPVGRRGGSVVYRSRRLGAPPSELELPKPAGTLRVFVVGGSVAFPFGNPFMQDPAARWRAAAPGTRVELVSAGVGGYDSERDLKTLRSVLAMSPDLVVVMSGNNENFMNDIPNPRLLALNGALRRSVLVRTLQDRFVRTRSKRQTAEDVERRFEANLRAMVAQARQANVPVILCTLPANLRDIAPVHGYAGLRHPDWTDARFVDGLRAFEAGRARAAMESWRRYAAARPLDPFGAFYLGRASDALGDRAAARRYYRLAGDLTAPPDVRCRPARNETIRRVAAETKAPVVDLERLFADLSGGVPGAAVMGDPCHWFHEYYPLILTRLLSAARPMLAGRLRLDERWLASHDHALRHPEITRHNARNYAAMAVRAGLFYTLTAYQAGIPVALSEYVISQFEVARLIAPDVWRDAADGPEGIRRIVGVAKGYFALTPEMFEGRWPLVWAHVAEEERRRGRSRQALALFDRALAERPDLDDVKVLRRLAAGDRSVL